MQKSLNLLEEPNLYKGLIEAAMDAIVIIDDQMQIVLINPAAQTMFGYSEPEVLGKRLEMLIPTRFRADHASHVERFGQGKDTSRKMGSLGSVYALRKNGEEFAAEASISKTIVNNHTFFTAILRDITERIENEIKIQGLTRLHDVQSGVNNAIVRIRDINMLFKEACRIVSEKGKFPVVWLGLYDELYSEITPVVCIGVDDHNVPLQIMEETNPVKKISILKTITHTQKSFILDELELDSSIINFDPSLNLNSLMAMPLIVDGKLKGILTVFANTKGFFDTEEIVLLDEVVCDISFAMLYAEKQAKINYLAYYDSLTGLANRDIFLDRLNQYIDHHSLNGLKFAVLIMDIHKFKSINDSYGRHAGDGLLIQIANRFERGTEDKQLRHARLGGDIFAIAIPEMHNVKEIAERVDNKFERYFGLPYLLEKSELIVTAKIGISIYPDDGSTSEALFMNAESALKQAKTAHEKYLFYNQHMNERVSELLKMENRLKRAIERQEFVIYYQPKVSLDKRNIVGVEALIRWMDPENGLVAPINFIPILEETGLILEIGEWLLLRAIKDINLWQEAGLDVPRVAINVSQVQLRQNNFVDIVRNAVALDSKPTKIDLEITESMIMDDMEGNIVKLKEIRDMGIDVSVDDFGTGYSSLAYLAKLPVHTLKIDKSFISSMLDDSNSMTLVSTIISLAHSLQLEVIAEGVESEEQAKILHLLRCNQMQGYLYSKPVPFDEITHMLKPRL